MLIENWIQLENFSFGQKDGETRLKILTRVYLSNEQTACLFHNRASCQMTMHAIFHKQRYLATPFPLENAKDKPKIEQMQLE